MKSLSEEASLRGSSVIGAYLLWHFVKAYYETSKRSPNVVLLFVALPILLNASLTYDGSKTTSDETKKLNYLSYIIFRKLDNLSDIRSKITKKKEQDLLATLTQTVRKKMQYTSESLDIAVATNLLRWDVDSATIHIDPGVNYTNEKKMLDPIVLKMAARAKQLGEIFAGWGDEHSVIIELGVKL